MTLLSVVVVLGVAGENVPLACGLRSDTCSFYIFSFKYPINSLKHFQKTHSLSTPLQSNSRSVRSKIMQRFVERHLL